MVVLFRVIYLNKMQNQKRLTLRVYDCKGQPWIEESDAKTV